MILDTSVVVAATERRDPVAMRLIRSLDGRATRSFVVSGELAAGARTSRYRPMSSADQQMRAASAAAYEQLCDRPTELRIEEMSDHFGEITALANVNGVRVGQNDRWMLAEAMALGVRVATLDRELHRLGEVVSEAIGLPTCITEFPT